MIILTLQKHFYIKYKNYLAAVRFDHFCLQCIDELHWVDYK